jgi:methionyl-tRNA formyltransferase
MKIFFFGQKSFGAAVLKRLIADGHAITGVAVPEPGQYYDRVHVLTVKENLWVLPVEKIASTDIPKDTELIVAAHSHHFISTKALDRVTHGGIGYHPSALPRHRGRDAVRWTVAMRDPITAGTVYWLDNRVDGGDILAQRFIHVSPAEDYHALWRRLFDLGVDMLSAAVSAVATGHAGVSHKPKNTRHGSRRLTATLGFTDRNLWRSPARFRNRKIIASSVERRVLTASLVRDASSRKETRSALMAFGNVRWETQNAILLAFGIMAEKRRRQKRY